MQHNIGRIAKSILVSAFTLRNSCDLIKSSHEYIIFSGRSDSYVRSDKSEEDIWKANENLGPFKS
jgi:hypothetical protein